jgi:PEP-CTERM motif
MKRYSTMLALLAGLILCSTQAFALTYLNENFEDVTGVTLTQTRTIQDIITVNPTELPSISSPLTHTSRTGTAAYTNIRFTKDVINTGTYGQVMTDNTVVYSTFNDFFPVNADPSTSKFMVVGDSALGISNAPYNTLSAVTMPFKTSSEKQLKVAFDWVFNGYDRNNLGHAVGQSASIYLTDITGHTQELVHSISTLRTKQSGSLQPNYGQGHYNNYVTLSPALVGNNLRIVFSLSEAGSTSDNYSNTALGVDNIKISSVPEPSTFLLLGAGITALAFLKRRRN